MTYFSLKKRIAELGYQYSLSPFFLVGVAVVLGTVVMGWIFKLKILFIVLIALFGIILYPKMIFARYVEMSNNDRFSNLTNYMENMIVAFKKTPKILVALEMSLDFVGGSMRDCVERAIYNIKMDTVSPNIYEKSLGIIEQEFKTSRLKSLHKFLAAVELGNSVNYQESLNNLYYDTHSWVTRIFAFQKQLKDTKQKIVITIVASLGVVAYFTHTLVSMEGALEKASVTGGLVYQIGTTVFLMILMILYTVVNSKLTGVWLVEDMSGFDKEKLFKKLDGVENYDRGKDLRNTSIASVVVLIVMSLVGIISHESLFIYIGAIIGIIVFIMGLNNYDSNVESIKKELIKEFPAWLRDVSVNLQNMVVVRAIEKSSKEASPLVGVFVDRFLLNINRDPASMRPYEEFFGLFKMPELTTSIKTLFSLQSLSESDAIRQVNDLTVRNQELITKSEELKLKDAISGIGFISAIPMLVMSFKLMCDMGVMLLQFMSAF